MLINDVKDLRTDLSVSTDERHRERNLAKNMLVH
jgi:hypothetical protein